MRAARRDASRPAGPPRRVPPLAAGLLAAALASGCATSSLQHPEISAAEAPYPRAVELRQTPFFPDDTHYCGPAALATLLAHSSVPVTAEALIDRVYLPEQQGSLQHELLGAARRADRVPYELAPELSALLTEISRGHPVLVLQNLTLELLPQWHYAVVVGYDLASETVTLRSADERRRTISMSRFERTWQRAGRWAVVIPPPGRTPASADADGWVAAVSELERQERWHAAHRAYLAATARWPDHAEAWLGLGNVHYTAERLALAQSAFERAVQADGTLAAAHYNLAWALLRQGETAEAVAAAPRAEAAAPDHPRYSQAADEILAEAGPGSDAADD